MLGGEGPVGGKICPVMGEGRLSGDESPANQRLTVPEAASWLGITEAAVRGRIKRGTLRSYREEGNVYVVLVGDSSRDSSTDQPATDPREPREELVESLQDQVAYMREQLAEEREARRRADTIIAQLTQANAEQARTIRELEPSPTPETRDAPETAQRRSDRGTAPEDAQEPAERRSWLHRFFFGP